MSAVIYTRSARDNNARIACQEAECRAFAERNGLTVTGVYTDIGKPGSSFDTMLETIEQDGIHHVIVAEPVVLGRVVMSHLQAITQLEKAGARVRVIQAGFGPSLDAIYRAGVATQREDDGSRIRYALANRRK